MMEAFKEMWEWDPRPQQTPEPCDRHSPLPGPWRPTQMALEGGHSGTPSPAHRPRVEPGWL